MKDIIADTFARAISTGQIASSREITSTDAEIAADIKAVQAMTDEQLMTQGRGILRNAISQSVNMRFGFFGDDDRTDFDYNSSEYKQILAQDELVKIIAQRLPDEMLRGFAHEHHKVGEVLEERASHVQTTPPTIKTGEHEQKRG